MFSALFEKFLRPFIDVELDFVSKHIKEMNTTFAVRLSAPTARHKRTSFAVATSYLTAPMLYIGICLYIILDFGHRSYSPKSLCLQSPQP